MTYVKATLGEKLVCNRYFDGLMVTAPWAVIFDGVTSWTVNHQDIVPAILVLGIYVDFENPAIRKLTLHMMIAVIRSQMVRCPIMWTVLRSLKRSGCLMPRRI